jgi:hypothetical protein
LDSSGNAFFVFYHSIFFIFLNFSYIITSALLLWNPFLVQSSQVPTDSNSNSSANKNEEKAGDGKYSSHSLDEVSAMICSTISLYGVKVIVFTCPLFHYKNMFSHLAVSL